VKINVDFTKDKMKISFNVWFSFSSYPLSAIVGLTLSIDLDL